MSRDGAGVHSLPAGYLAVNGETIQPSQHNPPLEDLSAAITESIARTGVTAITANIPFGGFKITGLGDATLATDALNRQTGDARYQAIGQCRLTKSGSDLLLSRYNGKILIINGAPCTIPSAGITLAATGLTVGTLYYIYATEAAGVVDALEASTTGHATDTATGAEIKSGDATRTLVGMAYVITGPAFADTAAQRLVVSWFNPRPIEGAASFSAIRTTTSTSYTEINTEIRVQFLTWAGSAIQIAANGGAYNSGANQTLTSFGIDSTSTPQDVGSFGSGANAQSLGLIHAVTLAEGFHYATVLGRVSAGTGNWFTNSNAAGERFTLKVVAQG